VDRVKPQASSEIPDIEEELGLKLSPLPWLPSFFSLPPEAQIASTLAYQQGKVIFEAFSSQCTNSFCRRRCHNLFGLLTISMGISCMGWMPPQVLPLLLWR
jgi:hypothetical protein